MKKSFLLLSTISLILILALSSCGLFQKKCTVTFDANGGTLDTEITVTVAQNSTVELPLPHKDGCTFIGWYLGEGTNEEKFTAKDTVTKDITLKAKWMNDDDITNNGVKIDIHTVTFNADGGSFNGEKTLNAQTYSTIKLPTPTKYGYVFLGWFIGEDASAAPFTASSLVTNDITLTAKWAKAEYTVSFIDYYGKVVKRDTVKYKEAAEAPIMPRIPEACLRFDAWDSDITSVTSDMEVKALYVLDSYTVTYVTGTDQSIPPTSYLFEEIPAVPPTPGLSGHYFIGWYLDKEFTEEYKFDTPLTSNITLYAYFDEAFPISTIDELLAIEQNTTKSYFLKNDIDCEGKVISSSIIGFAGTLDGEGHKIHNFAFQPASAATVGLFATNGGTIKNIGFDDFSYTLLINAVNSNVGFLIGNNLGKVENVHISGASLSFTNINCSTNYGAIAGSSSGEIKNCSAAINNLYLEVQTSSWYRSGTKYGYIYGAAIVGLNSGSVEGCSAEIATKTHNQNKCDDTYESGNASYIYLGGLVSKNTGSIKSSNAILSVTNSSNNYRTNETTIGGLVCQNEQSGSVRGCSSSLTATLTGYNSFLCAGGFAYFNGGTISDCYAEINVSSNVTENSRFGGFAVNNNGGTNHCYAKGEMNIGAATAGKGGFVGHNNGSVNSCFASVDISATNATAYGPFVGKTDNASFITNCYYKANASFTTNGVNQEFSETHSEAITHLSLTDAAFLKDTLGWSEEIWSFDAGKIEYPTLK